MEFDPMSHIGETHGIYTIVDLLPDKDTYGHWIYKCECVKCGYIRFSHYGAIAGPKSAIRCCNHLRANGEPKPYIKGVWKHPRIGSIFGGLMLRCYNKNDRSYRWYGARGVGVCDEWRSNPFKFEEWALSNGYTDNLTIDRIDSNKDYCPENCRWVTLQNNAKYKSTTGVLTVDNVSHTGKDWANECGLGCNTINTMLREHRTEDVVVFIRERLKDPNRTRRSHQTWFDVYGIKTCGNQA